MAGRWQERARELKREIRALAIAIRDPRTPRAARWLGAAVVAYALSPLDLIPDPIPVLGLLDDVILLPIGIWLTLRLIPDEVLADSRARAVDAPAGRGVLIVAGLVALAWLATAALGVWLVSGWT